MTIHPCKCFQPYFLQIFCIFPAQYTLLLHDVIFFHVSSKHRAFQSAAATYSLTVYFRKPTGRQEVLKLKVELMYEIHKNTSNMFQNNMQTLIINILYIIGANGARPLTRNSVRAFYMDGHRFCFLPHFAAPITTPYISQPAVCMQR